MTSTNQSPMSPAYKSCLSCLGWPTLKVFLRQNFVRQLTKCWPSVTFELARPAANGRKLLEHGISVGVIA